MQDEEKKCAACGHDAELKKLQEQLKKAQKMVESGFNQTDIVTNIEKKIDNLEKQIAVCKESNSPQK
jgi:hypothetical protein